MILGDNEWRFLKYKLPVRLFAESAEDKANWTRHKNIKYTSRSVYAWYHLQVLLVINFKASHPEIQYKKKCRQVTYLVTRRQLMSGSQDEISDNALIDFYQSMIDNGKVQPNGTAFKRMQFLQKRVISKKYKKLVIGLKSSNGAAIS